MQECVRLKTKLCVVCDMCDMCVMLSYVLCY